MSKDELIEMMTEAGESDEVKELVTKLYYEPLQELYYYKSAQSLEERYEYVKKSREEGNFEFFKKIADLLAENFTYFLTVGDDEWEANIYRHNYAYDFEFFLSLARFYQKNPTLFDGHCDIIKRMGEEAKQDYVRSRHPEAEWDKVKEFWLKYTIKRN